MVPTMALQSHAIEFHLLILVDGLTAAPLVEALCP